MKEAIHVDSASGGSAGMCDHCPRPGHFHGAACWVFEAPREAQAEACGEERPQPAGRKA